MTTAMLTAQRPVVPLWVIIILAVIVVTVVMKVLFWAVGLLRKYTDKRQGRGGV